MLNSRIVCFVTFHSAPPILKVSSDVGLFNVLGFHMLCSHLWAVLQVGTQMDCQCLAPESKLNPSQIFCRKAVSCGSVKVFKVNTTWKCLQLFQQAGKNNSGILMQSELNLCS